MFIRLFGLWDPPLFFFIISDHCETNWQHVLCGKTVVEQKVLSLTMRLLYTFNGSLLFCLMTFASTSNASVTEYHLHFACQKTPSSDLAGVKVFTGKNSYGLTDLGINGTRVCYACSRKGEGRHISVFFRFCSEPCFSFTLLYLCNSVTLLSFKSILPFSGRQGKNSTKVDLTLYLSTTSVMSSSLA